MAVSPAATRPSEDEGPRGAPAVPQRRRPRRMVLVVVVLGLCVTGALTAGSRIAYLHDEQRLTTLQASLVADALASAPVDIERRLGVAAQAAAESTHPAAVFSRLINPSMARHHGPFSSAGLASVARGRVQVLVRIGIAPLHPNASPYATAFFLQAARSAILLTDHPVTSRGQRLGYGLSVPGRHGTYVAFASQVLPRSRRLAIPASNPESDYNIALYFGRSRRSVDLLFTNAARLPISGTVSVAHVPFGTSVLTLVSSPRTSLAGAWPATLPWAILGVGLALTALVAALVDRLMRREALAARYATEVHRLYDRQRTVAETLQHALLPDAIPEVDGLEFAARYVAGTRGLEVGGDWYDVVVVDGGVVVSVGDVSGRGLAAASTMATLRHAMRARATYGLAPGELLSQLSGLVDLVRDGHFATVSCARIDAATGRCELASAGHLPPVIVEGAAARLVDVPTGPPIGLGEGKYEEARLTVPPGATLLLYTDGLVERRDERLDVSLERLRAASAAAPPLDERLDGLLAAFVGAGAHDDVALIATRRVP